VERGQVFLDDLVQFFGNNPNHCLGFHILNGEYIRHDPVSTCRCQERDVVTQSLITVGAGKVEDFHFPFQRSIGRVDQILFGGDYLNFWNIKVPEFRIVYNNKTGHENSFVFLIKFKYTLFFKKTVSGFLMKT
jgi:hypothetical protein